MIIRTHRTARLRTSAAAKLTSRSAFTRTALLAGVLAAALGVAACSSSSSSSSSPSSGATTSGTSAAAAPKGALIKIGVIGSLTGAQASSSDQGATVAPAWAAWINANGGIDGHPVQVIVMDDKGDPATAQAAGQQFIADGVSAIIVSSDNLVSAFDSAAIAKGIPLIGGPSDENDWYTKPGMFATMTGIVHGLAPRSRSPSSTVTRRSSPTCTAPRSPPARRPTPSCRGRPKRPGSATPSLRSAPQPRATPRSACS